MSLVNKCADHTLIDNKAVNNPTLGSIHGASPCQRFQQPSADEEEEGVSDVFRRLASKTKYQHVPRYENLNIVTCFLHTNGPRLDKMAAEVVAC